MVWQVQDIFLWTGDWYTCECYYFKKESKGVESYVL